MKFGGISALVIDEIWLTVPFEITSLPLRGSGVVVRRNSISRSHVFLGFRFPKGIKNSAGITARAYTLKHIQKDAL